jgi:hypothetical protein
MTTCKCQLRNKIFYGNALQTIKTFSKGQLRRYAELHDADLTGVYCNIKINHLI